MNMKSTIHFQRDTKLKIADISSGSISTESTHQKWKQTPSIIGDELIVPDKVLKTAPDCQDVECSSAELYIHKRSKLSTSLVTDTCLNNSNKRHFIKKTVNASSATRRICSESKTGGTYCIARWCNNAKKTPGVSLFRIPKDPDRSVPVL